MKRWGFFIASVIALVGWCVFIFVMSSEPADESIGLSMGFVSQIIGLVVPGYDQMSPADQLCWQNSLDHIVRKTAHFLEYALLGALTLNAFWQGLNARRAARADSRAIHVVSRTTGADNNTTNADNRTTHTNGHVLPTQKFFIVASWAFATLYAITDEFHQSFVLDRIGRASDVLLDSVGALVGAIVAALVLQALDRRRARNHTENGQ